MNSKRAYSIRTKIISLLLLFIVPLVALLIIYNFYSISILREETVRLNKNTLSLYTQVLDNSLAYTDSFLLEQVTINVNFNTLRHEKNGLKLHLATYEIVNNLEKNLNISEDVDMFFLYSHSNNVTREVYRDSFGDNYNANEKLLMRKYILEMTSTGENFVPKKWFPIEIEGHYFLIRLFGTEGTYVGALIDVEHLVFPLSKMAIEENYVLIYNTIKGEPLIMRDLIKANNIDLSNIGDTYHLSGSPQKYVVLSEPLVAGDIFMTTLIPDTTIIEGLSGVQRILLLISFLTILIIPSSIYLIRKIVINPIDQLVETINRIKNGHWDTRMNGTFVSSEFRLVSHTFNSMIDEIQSLKIEAYEEKIGKQKAQLQHLIYQNKPHFFLNILKNLYGMAEREQYSDIQTMVLILSNHLRYMFKDHATLVLLKDEVNYVKNYLDIQELCMPIPPECKIDIEERLINFKVPPISLQTFVENSIKHGSHPDRQLKIIIKATILETEDGDFANITVSDNGVGFTPIKLEALNFEKIYSDEGQSIGLLNIRQRLRLIFGEEAKVYFSVGLQGGAVSEMIIPMNREYNESRDEE